MQNIVFKVNKSGDARRFALDGSGAPSYDILHSTILKIYALAPGTVLRIVYADEDGDEILVSSTTELMEAIRFYAASASVVKLNVDVAASAAPAAPAAPAVPAEPAAPAPQPAAVAAPQPAAVAAPNAQPLVSAAPVPQAPAAQPQAPAPQPSEHELRASVSGAYESLADELVRRLTQAAGSSEVFRAVQNSMRAVQASAPGLVQAALAASRGEPVQLGPQLGAAAQALAAVPALVGGAAGPAIQNVLSSLPNTQEGWMRLAQQSAEQAQRLSQAAGAIAVGAQDAARRAADAAAPLAMQALGRAAAAAAASPAGRAALATAVPAIATAISGISSLSAPQPAPAAAPQPAPAAAPQPAPAAAAPPQPPVASLYPPVASLQTGPRGSEDILSEALDEMFAPPPPAPPAAPAPAAPAASAGPVAPTGPPAGASCSFKADVTVPDGTSMAPGQEFTKIWRLANTGATDWLPDYALVCTGGDPLGVEAGTRVRVGRAVPRGTDVEVAVALRAPRAAGAYRSEWRMTTGEGHGFGGRVWAAVRVAAGGPARAPPAGTSAVVFEALLGQLRAMGFENEAANADALVAANCDLAAAVDRLTGGL